MNEVSKEFTELMESINNNIKKSGLIEKETDLNEANKLNGFIKEYIKISSLLVPLLKKNGTNSKLSSIIEVISNIIKDKILQELDEESDKIKEITNKIIPDMIEIIKAKYKTEIDKTQSLSDNRVKIYDALSKQIDEIKRQLLDKVYVKKAFELYSNEQIDNQINELKVYFSKK